MVMIRLSIFLAALGVGQASAAEAFGRFSCGGTQPDWQLDIGGTDAVLQFEGRTTTFEIQPPVVVAEGQTSPRAVTLLAEADTAIVILRDGLCPLPGQDGDASVSVLTQRNITPILLSGCCTPHP